MANPKRGVEAEHRRTGSSERLLSRWRAGDSRSGSAADAQGGAALERSALIALDRCRSLEPGSCRTLTLEVRPEEPRPVFAAFVVRVDAIFGARDVESARVEEAALVYTLHFSMALDSMGIKDRQAIGNYSAIASIAVPFGALLFKLISNRSGAFQFACMFFLIGAGLIGIGLAKTINLTVAAAWVQQLGCGMMIFTLIAWGLKQLAPEFRGRGMGFWTSGFFLGQFLSPLVVSGMRNITGSLLNAFVVFGMICLLIAAVNFYLSKKS